MRVVSWNVNSLNARQEHFYSFLQESKPDIVLLQELKGEREKFPFAAVEGYGYTAAVVGQKAYNGVAIISRFPVEEIVSSLPLHTRTESNPPAARYIEALVAGIRVASVYVPNGESVTSDKYPYKLAFLDDLRRHIRSYVTDTTPFILGGDFNIAPSSLDVWQVPIKEERILYSLAERQALRRILHDGFTDTYRALYPHERAYSWWDYRTAAFARNEGWRIDMLLANAAAADHLQDAGIDSHWRGLEKPSDHTPVWCSL